MTLKDTYQGLRELLNDITVDLAKAEHGNKAAAQRVRTGTVKMEKLSKVYRKESIQSEKKEQDSKKGSYSGSKAKNAKARANVAKGKAPASKAKIEGNGMAVKHATAKLPVKKK